MNPDSSVVTCPACAASLPVPVEHFGKPIRCGQCNQVFNAAVPKIAPVPVPADDNPFAIPNSPVESDEGEEQPRPRSKPRPAEQKAGLGTPVIIGAAVAGLLVLGGAALGIRYALKDKEPAKPTESANKGKEQPKPREKEKPKEKELPLGPGGKMADEVRAKVKASTAYIRTVHDANRISMGSGFFAAGKGLVVTNAHVVGQTEMKTEPVREIQVIINSGLPDERVFKAQLLKTDRQLDLALLKIDDAGQSPPPLEVIDAFNVQETQEVYIFGFPGGETIGRNVSVNISTVSSIRRDQFVSWIQIAGGMHKGNSGGPVTDVHGRVIGVSVAMIKDTQINMAIPGDSVHNFFNNAGDLIPKK